MNLFEILKQFKSIEPDKRFAEQSKRAILATPRMEPLGLRRGILRFIETAVAVTLAGFFVLLITGGIVGAPTTAPIQYSVIDAQGIRAEAQAIDMQIELANVNYAEVAATTPSSAIVSPAAAPAAESTVQTSTPLSAPAPLLLPPASSTATATAGGGEGSSTISIDRALEQLSQ